MRILFLGETPAPGPARYLAAILTSARLPFDYVPDGAALPARLMRKRYNAVILSDYRRANFTRASEQWLCAQPARGAGLLMIGGWASFTGLVGGYAGSPIESFLPVRCVGRDDRVNWTSGAALLPAVSVRGKTIVATELLQNLSWQTPPVVCGYHRVFPRAESETLLRFHDLRFVKGRPTLGRTHPALAVLQRDRWRSAAFMTDCAPHWAGGLVDWGARRLRVRLGSKTIVEVGDQYVQFFSRLIRWVANAPTRL